MKTRQLKLFLLSVDVLSFGAILNGVYFLYMGTPEPNYAMGPVFLISILSIVVCHYIFNLYEPYATPDLGFVWRLATAAAAYVMAISSIALLTKLRYEGGLAGRGILYSSLGLFTAWSLAWRYLFSRYRQTRSQRSEWIFIGGVDALSAVLSDINRHSFNGAICLLTPSVSQLKKELKKLNLSLEYEIAAWSSLQKKLESPIRGVVIAQNTKLTPAMQRSLMQARIEGSRIYDLTDFYEMVWSAIPVLHLKEGWFVFSHGFNLLHNQIGLRVKRLIDIVSALLLLLITFPFMVLTGLAVLLESGRPIFYSQVRNGQSGRTFRVVKFRSMVVGAERGKAKWASVNDRRVTRVGRIIRKLRLDELPQLVNVLRGQMSFIGPRPERPEFDEQLEKEIPYYRLRYTLKPGLTGWAQVNYPYGASIEDAKEKLQYDLYYIKNYSLFLDIAIALQTIRVVLHLKGR